MSANSKSEKVVKWMPFDIIADAILYRLPVKSLARFRCVCKQWCSLTSDSNFIKKHLKEALKTTESLTIFCIDESPSENLLLYSFIQINSDCKVTHSSSYLNLEDTAFYTSSNSVNGLICIVRWFDRSPGCGYPSLVNPITRQSLELKRINKVGDENGSIMDSETLALGFDDSTGVYKVVRSGNIVRSKCCYLEVLAVGTQEWRRVGEVSCFVYSEQALSLNGALYWLVIMYDHDAPLTSILAFDIKEERFQFIPIPKSLANRRDISLISIRIIEGHLCLVRKSNRPTCEVNPPTLIIWKLKNYAEHKWEQEYVINMSSWANGKEIMRLDARVIDLDARVIDLVYGKLLMQMPDTICYYDINSGTSRILLCRPYLMRLEAFTESLVSPSSLAVL